MSSKVIGKKLTAVIQYSPDEQGLKEYLSDLKEGFETFEQQIVRIKKEAGDLLKNRGHDPSSPYHYFRKGFGHDSLEAIASEIIFHIDRMLLEDMPISRRLEHAVKLGQADILIKHYLPQGIVQRGNAKKPRAVEINELVQKLAKEDAPAKELWLRFYGLLDEEGFSPCESENENKYSYINSNGKEKPITFGTFQNKLSKYRKR